MKKFMGLRVGVGEPSMRVWDWIEVEYATPRSAQSFMSRFMPRTRSNQKIQFRIRYHHRSYGLRSTLDPRKGYASMAYTATC